MLVSVEPFEEPLEEVDDWDEFERVSWLGFDMIVD